MVVSARGRQVYNANISGSLIVDRVHMQNCNSAVCGIC